MALVLALVMALLPTRHPARAWTYTVTNTDNAGFGSLRQVIIDANNSFGPDTIDFKILIPGNYCDFLTGVCTIQPTSPLPALTDDAGTTIDGYTQPGANRATGTIKIKISGSSAGDGANGLTITSANNIVEGVQIYGFSSNGIEISGSGATDNIISGNTIGGGNGNGVLITDGAQNNTIGGNEPAERNVISDNSSSGVYISGSDTMSNTVSGNYIGTDADGTAAWGNDGDGVVIDDANNNTIGGMADERNVISGNDGCGVLISFGSGNTVSGNYIGTDASGTVDMGNTCDGVCIGEARNNTVGGNTDGERNVISGNDGNGVVIFFGSDSNTVSGNYIGTDASGTADLGNTDNGVEISVDARNNIVGGDTASERNVISGNDGHGVSISWGWTTGNTISGNYIGTDASGTADLANDWDGVYISGGAHNNTVGLGNVIAHNGDDGVVVSGSSTISNTITQNSIFSNTLGIDLRLGANGNITAPVILTTTVGSVNVVGTACPNCTVELFENSDTDGEGETYVGDVTTDANGAFTITVSSLSKPYLTATATDAVSGTSEFSAVFTATVTGGGSVYLPLIMKNH
jgi:hypothetical protein